MLRQIRIQNLGAIQDAVLELSPGLNVVSGETGAGKTMVVSGLGLLLGARADPALVRSGASKAVVEGIFELDVSHPACRRAVEAGADLDLSPGRRALADQRGGALSTSQHPSQHHELADLIIVRAVSDAGRSRVHVGGRAAPVGLLAEIGQALVAVHGQSDQWRLRQPEQHRLLLDRYAGDAVQVPLTAYEHVFDEHSRLRAELDQTRALTRDRAREIGMLRAGLEQVASVNPQPGEDEQLDAEAARLAHADALRGAAGLARALLTGDDDVHGDGAAVLDRLAAARSAVAGVSAHDSVLADLGIRLAELGYLAADVAADLGSYVDAIDADPARLAVVQQRRSELTRLQRSFGDTVADVLAWAGEAAARVAELEGADDRVAVLEHRLAEMARELADQAAHLSAARREAAGRLATDVNAELSHLAMGTARLHVSVGPRQDMRAGLRIPSVDQEVRLLRHGADEVQLQLAAGSGVQPRDVGSVASGGELSRVMLALEVVTRGGDAATYVFDEVDAGVGGTAAVDVGARLAALAETAQVIVVTHLAQVAAYADRHLVVRKTDDGQVTASGVHEVTGPQRLREVARMMTGLPDSGLAVEHAGELVETARQRVAR